jgi:hypothetical protein
MVLCTGKSYKQRWSPIALFHIMTDPGYQLRYFVSPIGILAWYTLDKLLQLLNEPCIIIFQLLFQCINACYPWHVENCVKLLPIPQPCLHTRTYAQIYPSAQIATQLRSVLARVYSVSRQNLNTTTVP